MKTCPQCETEKPLSDFYLVRGKPMKQCKQCHKANVSARYRENPEPAKARSKKWAEDYPERYESRRKAYYARTKKEHIKRAQKWVEENRERRQEIAREWTKRNAESVRFRNRIIGSRRRQRIIANGVNIDRESWDAIMAIFPHICMYCGKDYDKLTMDHFVPVALGGKTEPGNLLPCCRPCNSKKNAKPPEKWLAEIGYVDKRGEGYVTIHQFLDISRRVLLEERERETCK